ncbi:unnamed protein product [Caenorhabditis nigoni]
MTRQNYLVSRHSRSPFYTMGNYFPPDVYAGRTYDDPSMVCTSHGHNARLGFGHNFFARLTRFNQIWEDLSNLLKHDWCSSWSSDIVLSFYEFLLFIS